MNKERRVKKIIYVMASWWRVYEGAGQGHLGERETE